MSEAAAPNPNAAYWEGELIRLHALQSADAEAWLAEDTDSEAIRALNYEVTPPKSRAMAEEWATTWADFTKADERNFFSIETLAGEYVGNINIHTMDRRNGTFQTGTRLFRAFRRRGYAFEAKRIVLRYAFHELRFQKYNLRCLETNVAIIRHAERIGCQDEGRIRRAASTEGRSLDERLFGLTRRGIRRWRGCAPLGAHADPAAVLGAIAAGRQAGSGAEGAPEGGGIAVAGLGGDLLDRCVA